MMKEPQDDGDERADETPLVAEPESFGTWLRRQREVREIDLREIADSSKVSMSYLRAFEEDRFDVLPAPVFANGFLRQYARYVGLDPEEVVNFYLAARQPEGDEEAALQPRAEPEPPARKYVFFVLAATAALVLLVWLLSVFSDRTPQAPQAVPPSAVPESQSAADVDPTASSGAAAGVDVPSARPPTPAPEPEPRQPEEPAPPLRVTLDFLSDCWVEASVDGVEKLSELKVQGESLLLDAEEVVEFKVGDVGAVQVEVNGRPFEIKSRRGTSVRNVRIDLATAATLAAGAGAQSIAPPEEVAPEGRRRNAPGAGR